MARVSRGRTAALLALAAILLNVFAACVDDRSVSLAPPNTAGTSGAGSDAPGTGGSAGTGGTAGDASTGDAPNGGSSGDSGGTGGNPESGPEAGVALEAFCDAVLSEVCTWIKGCQRFVRCEDWPNYSRIQTTCLAGPAAVAAGRLRYDPIEAKACLDAVSGTSVGPDAGPCVGGGPVIVNSLNLGLGSCVRAFTGLVPTGGECYTESSLGSSECAGGVCFRSMDGECPGTCVAYRKLGETCGAVGQYCSPDAFCNVNFCAARRSSGAQCDDAKQCQAGMVCVALSDGGTLKQCVTVGSEGDPCQVYEGCGGRECYEGKCRHDVPSGAPCHSDWACPDDEVCVWGSPINKVGTCRQPLQVGTACGKDTDCLGHQPIPPSSGPTCRSSDGVAPPVCRAPARPLEPCGGRPCNPGPCDYIACEAGAYCDTYSGGSSVCKSLVESGGACTNQAQCAAGLVCMSATTCRPPAALGQPCSPENHTPPSCQAGLFCDWNTRACAVTRYSGQPCTPQWSNSCEPAHYCACLGECPSIDWNNPVQTMCTPKGQNGNHCQASSECLNGYCNSGKCERYPLLDYCDGIDDARDAGSEAG